MEKHTMRVKRLFPSNKQRRYAGFAVATRSEQYLVMGMVLMFVCIGMVVSLLLIGAARGRDITSVELTQILLVCLTAAVVGILGGYIVGEYTGLRKAARHSPPPT